MRIAVVPARGGSRRIPRKNVREFCGRPILAYSVDAARSSGCFDRVIVSTDDVDIARIAREAGAEVPFWRPPELADDYTGTNAVAAHAVRWFEERGEHVEQVCCLYPTAPFLQAETIRAGLRALEKSGADFAVTVTWFPFPVQRAVRRTIDGRLEPMWPEHIGARSQDLERAYHDAGQMYWGSASAFLNERPLFAPSTVAVVLPPERVHDIDTEADWRLAELKYRLLESDVQGEEGPG